MRTQMQVCVRVRNVSSMRIDQSIYQKLNKIKYQKENLWKAEK